MMNAYAHEKAAANNNPISQSTINNLNAALSKMGRSVLITLYQTPRIQQKVLAANLYTSAASLSNLLNKLDTIRPALLVIEHVGRSKYYSLTDIAKQYVSSELISRGTYHINAFFTAPANTSLLDETLKILFQFQSLAGSNWLLILDDMLSNDSGANEADDELTNLYIQFTNNMKQMYLRKESLSIRKIYDKLSNNILVNRLENYLKNSLNDTHALIPLFDLENQNPKRAVELINYIFAEIKPQTFGTDDLSLFPNHDLPVSEEQYHAIFHQILIMANEFSTYRKPKLQVLKTWEKTFCVSSISLYFIAEKCNTIFLTESEKH